MISTKLPHFELETDEKPFSTKNLHRWLVLYFYPKDLTPGCTNENVEFNQLLDQFEQLGTLVVGVSPDSKEQHAQFRAKHHLRQILACDPTHEIMEQLGGWGEKTLYGKTVIGVKRSTLLINPQGIIVHHWKAAKSKGHAASVLKKLQSFIKAENNPK